MLTAEQKEANTAYRWGIFVGFCLGLVFRPMVSELVQAVFFR